MTTPGAGGGHRTIKAVILNLEAPFAFPIDQPARPWPAGKRMRNLTGEIAARLGQGDPDGLPSQRRSPAGDHPHMSI
ncbi:MAG: hypothetical protein ACYCTZ_13165 [Candidatus Dormibacteria bacterium]